ncbi:MAG TPA: carbohydrate kinase [Chthoniobacteraceae bacterium]|jgi:fructokinase|nr:carbohydrate kinase [Chthoniobacteraceae bacterium]
MTAESFAFGEILWDCLPSGRHAGGAPFNVCAHLTQLDCAAALISSVGRDPLGDEILQVAVEKGVDTRLITRARIGLPTGTVNATIDAQGNATYDIVQPVAWDEIFVSEQVLEAVAQARAFVFGSLAGRSPYNLEQLDQLLALPGPVKFFDVNLRPPFADPKLVLDLAQRADVIKLNDDEVGRLAAWLQTGAMTGPTPRDAESLGDACARVAAETATRRICVTRGPDGAALWEGGRLVCVPAPHVEVRDTVGAGDAFMAGLMRGLTNGLAIRQVLESACRLGAFVASHDGATPIFPEELRELFRTANAPA